MKKIILIIVSFVLMFGISGCSQDKKPTVKKTFRQTPVERSEEYADKSEEVTLQTYYEMSDGTWRTADCTYQYKLVITGRLNNAVRDTTYTILSNREDISFEEAWKASGLSSNLGDYFKPEEAVFVAVQ